MVPIVSQHHHPKTPQPEFLEWAKRTYTYNPNTGIFINNKTGKPKLKAAHGYIQLTTRINGKSATHRAHHIAWYLYYGIYPTLGLDHINSISTDNRICNLQELSQAENARKGKNVKYHQCSRGVTFHKQSGKWMVQVTINKKLTYLGLFLSQQEAEEVVRLALDGK